MRAFWWAAPCRGGSWLPHIPGITDPHICITGGINHVNNKNPLSKVWLCHFFKHVSMPVCVEAPHVLAGGLGECESPRVWLLGPNGPINIFHSEYMPKRSSEWAVNNHYTGLQPVKSGAIYFAPQRQLVSNHLSRKSWMLAVNTGSRFAPVLLSIVSPSSAVPIIP